MLRNLLQPLFRPLLRPLAASGARTPIQRAVATLRRLGTNAHIYLPGVGIMNGLQTGNYLDSAGTTAGAVDQPVGLALSAAGALGVEMANAYTIVNTTGTGATLPATVTSAAAGTSGVRTSANTEIGKTYQITATWDGNSANRPIRIACGGDYSVSPSTAVTGTLVAVLKATSGTDFGWVYNTAAASGEVFRVTAFSVREVTGIHASQATAANRPILRRGAVNLLTYSQDFTNAAWLKSSVTVSGSVLTITSTLENTRQSCAVTPGAVYTYALLAKRGTMTDVKTSIHNASGAADIQAPNSYFAEINSVTSSIVVRSFTAPAGCTSVFVYLSRDSGATGTVIVEAAALFQGTLTAAQIQALGGIPLTTTAPASTALGPYSWDTSGGKSFSATFPAGNESVTVIDARPTGQVTATAQNVVGSYNASVALGVEMVVNGDFSGGSTGWTVSGGSAPYNVTFTGGTANFAGSAAFINVASSAAIVAGKAYLCTVTVTSISASSIRFNLGGAFGSYRATPGTFSEIIVAAAAGFALMQDTSGATVATIDNVSVREVNPISGKIIVNGALTAPDLLLLQNFANKVAGL